MGGNEGHKTIEGTGVWGLARRQHGVVTREQLLALGYTRHGIAHRVAAGRLHVLHRRVFSVGSPNVSQFARWMAAVLACGPAALLSHQSAAELWEIRPSRAGRIELSLPYGDRHRAPGVVVHRRRVLTSSDYALRSGIPV